jgi:Ca2+:H+ antiporter
MGTRFIVTLAWILKKPLTLLFDPYESIAMFLSGKYTSCVATYEMAHKFAPAVLTVNYVVQDGKSNWLEGFILICQSCCLHCFVS